MAMTNEQIYAAIDELNVLLKASGQEKLATILEHRVYKVSWTSGSELLENIASILVKYIGEQGNDLDNLTVDKMKLIIKSVESIIHEQPMLQKGGDKIVNIGNVRRS